jgi:hypothetical protein
LIKIAPQLTSGWLARRAAIAAEIRSDPPPPTTIDLLPK